MTLIMVEKNALNSNLSPLLQKMLVLLTDLQVSSQNDVFVNHIKNALIEWDATQNSTIEAYADFIKSLLDVCTTNLVGDSILVQHIKLVKTCLTPPISEHELLMLSECIDHAVELLRQSTQFDVTHSVKKMSRTPSPVLQKMATSTNTKFPQPTSKTAKKGKFYGPVESNGVCAIDADRNADRHVEPHSGDAGAGHSYNIGAALTRPPAEYSAENAAKMQLLHFPPGEEQRPSALLANSELSKAAPKERGDDAASIAVEPRKDTNNQGANRSPEPGNRNDSGHYGIFNKGASLDQQAAFSVGDDVGLYSHKALVENQVRSNKAYYLQADEQRNEMARLYSTLVLEMRATIAETSAFGVDLGLEIAALQEAPSHEEIDKRRSAVLASLTQLSADHTELARKLDAVREFLSILKAGNKKLNDELDRARKLSLTDELTSLPNRRAFIRRLDDEVSRARRYGVTLSMVLIDIDNFKQVNDQHGHSAGDAVLRVYAEKILSSFRHHDMIARYGGEEFAVLLPNTDLDGVMRALLKVKNQVPQANCDVNGVAIQIPTFSAGMAEYRPSESPAQLIERADVALYRAKRHGRNRIESEQPLPEKSIID